MSEITREKPGVKFLWSHQGRLHRYFVKTANKVLRMLPFRAKYLAVAKAKGRNIPYSLVEGKTVVQVVQSIGWYGWESFDCRAFGRQCS